jgi:hypothetical protein
VQVNLRVPREKLLDLPSLRIPLMMNGGAGGW